MAQISKTELGSAIESLAEAFAECAAQPEGSKAYKLFRDATIQRFEFCIDIAWKVAMKTLGLPHAGTSSFVMQPYRGATAIF